MTAHGAFAWSRRLRGMDWFGCKELGHMKLTDRQANEILDHVRGKRGKRFDVLRAYAMNALRANAAKRLAVIALTALALTLPAQAMAAGPLTSVVDGRLHVWPVVGTYAYSASCAVTHAWEDHSAIAYCTEDGATYVYDPDTNPGWYVQN